MAIAALHALARRADIVWGNVIATQETPIIAREWIWHDVLSVLRIFPDKTPCLIE
jgi:hypothetical protein